MITGLYTAASGMVAYQTKLDTLANNLANVETSGFKADILPIESSVSSTTDVAQAGQSGVVYVGQPRLDPTPGPLRTTSNPLDLALVGPGLFVVETPQGERYTRAGQFTRDAQGFLATADGHRVLGTGGPVTVPDTGLQVAEDGTITGGGRLRIVAGPDAPGLVKEGLNLYAPAEGAPAPGELTTPRVLQGQFEASNVSPVLAMVEMLATLRSYEAYQKTMQSLDGTLAQTNELGRV